MCRIIDSIRASMCNWSRIDLPSKMSQIELSSSSESDELSSDSGSDELSSDSPEWDSPQVKLRICAYKFWIIDIFLWITSLSTLTVRSFEASSSLSWNRVMRTLFIARAWTGETHRFMNGNRSG